MSERLILETRLKTLKECKKLVKDAEEQAAAHIECGCKLEVGKMVSGVLDAVISSVERHIARCTCESCGLELEKPATIDSNICTWCNLNVYKDGTKWDEHAMADKEYRQIQARRVAAMPGYHKALEEWLS